MRPLPDQAAETALTPWWCLVCGSAGTADVLVNVALFLPLGWCLRCAGVSWRAAVASAFLLSLSIELLQAFVVAGRDASLSDVLANSCGAITGAALWRIAPTLMRPDPRTAGRLLAIGLAAWVAVLGFSSWALHPSAATLTSVNTHPTEPGEGIFRGRVLAAAAPDHSHFAVMFLDGAREGSPAPIADVVDAEGNVILRFSQGPGRFRFFARTNGVGVRLRGVSVGAIAPSLSAQDTVKLAGRASASALELTIDVRGRGTAYHAVAARSLGVWEGWRLILPSDGAWQAFGPLFAAVWCGGPAALLLWWVSRRTRKPAGQAPSAVR